MLVVRFEPILSLHKQPVKLDNSFSLKRCFAGGMLFEYRGVAQPGSAPAWGAGGRWFKSTRPDHSPTSCTCVLVGLATSLWGLRFFVDKVSASYVLISRLLLRYRTLTFSATAVTGG